MVFGETSQSFYGYINRQKDRNIDRKICKQLETNVSLT